MSRVLTKVERQNFNFLRHIPQVQSSRRMALMAAAHAIAPYVPRAHGPVAEAIMPHMAMHMHCACTGALQSGPVPMLLEVGSGEAASQSAHKLHCQPEQLSKSSMPYTMQQQHRL